MLFNHYSHMIIHKEISSYFEQYWTHYRDFCLYLGPTEYQRTPVRSEGHPFTTESKRRGTKRPELLVLKYLLLQLFDLQLPGECSDIQQSGWRGLRKQDRQVELERKFRDYQQSLWELTTRTQGWPPAIYPQLELTNTFTDWFVKI